MQKEPGIGSEAVAAGNGVGTMFDPFSQLAAEAKGSGGAKGRQGAWDGSRLSDEGSFGPVKALCFAYVYRNDDTARV